MIKLIIYILFMGIAGFLGYRRGWGTEGRMGFRRSILIGLICAILANAVFDIVKKKFWNNSQEENVVETQTNLIEE